MKKLARSLLTASTLIATSSATAFIDGISPLVGVDYQQVWMKGNGIIGASVSNGPTPKSYPGGTVYLGIRSCECLGVELGWDWAGKRSQNSVATTARGSTNLTLNVRRQGGHLDLLGYLPVADCFELMAGVGVGYVNAKVQGTSSNTAVVNNFSGTAKSSVGRLRVGGNYMFNECIGARALVGWESTSNLHYTLAGVKYKPFKDSVTAAVGLFYKF